MSYSVRLHVGSRMSELWRGLVDVYLTRRAAAAFISINPETLRSWHYRGGGPPMVKFGRMCRYEQSKLIAWAAQQAKKASPPVAVSNTNGG